MGSKGITSYNQFILNKYLESTPGIHFIGHIWLYNVVGSYKIYHDISCSLLVVAAEGQSFRQGLGEPFLRQVGEFRSLFLIISRSLSRGLILGSAASSCEADSNVSAATSWIASSKVESSPWALSWDSSLIASSSSQNSKSSKPSAAVSSASACAKLSLAAVSATKSSTCKNAKGVHRIWAIK